MRHVAVGTVAAAVVVAGGMPLVGTSRQAGAQEAAFEAGSGRAQAQVARVGPSRGSLALAPTIGLALADHLSTQGRGDARTADLGILADFLPPELAGAFPTVTAVSTEEGSETGKNASLGAPGAPGAAEIHADAGDAPYGASRARVAPLDLVAVAVEGGEATAFSGVRDGKLREAIGAVRIAKLDIGAGALVLEGLEWTATHRSGGESSEQANFTVGSVSVAGQRFAAPDGAEQPLADALGAAEPVLSQLGIHIQLPTARVEGGFVEMSPLRVRVADPALGAVISPVLEGVQPARDALVDAIRSGTEDADVALLLADVALGLVAGGSKLDIEVGGVSAQTAEPAERFSFGAGGGGFDLSAPPASPALSGAAAPPFAGGSAATGAASPSLGGSPSGATPSAAPSASGTKSSGSGGPLAAAPAGSSSPSGGAGPLLPIGLAAVAAAGLAGTADYQRVRRQPLPSPVAAA